VLADGGQSGREHMFQLLAPTRHPPVLHFCRCIEFALEAREFAKRFPRPSFTHSLAAPVGLITLLWLVSGLFPFDFFGTTVA